MLENAKNPMPPSAARRIRFGEAVWDPAAQQLMVRGERTSLPWRSLACLAVLLEAQGSLVSKEDLESRVWNGALIEDSNVSHAVAAVRKALDPAPDGGSYILTVPRVGYRLTVPVEEEPTVHHQQVPVQAPGNPARRRAAWVLTAAALLSLAGFAGFVLPELQRDQRAEVLVREGLLHSRRGIPSESEKAVALFERALLEQPGYAPARAALAETTARFSNGPAEAAITMAREALQSDPACDECMAILGYILMTREWAWEEAGDLLERAIESDPQDLQRQLWYAQWLSVQGRLAEAQHHAERAIQLDSTRPHGRALLAGIHYFAGRHSQAIQEAQTAIAMNRKHYQAYLWLERSYMMAGRDLDVIGARGAGTAAWFDWSLPMEREYCLRFQSLLGEAGRGAVANAFIDDVSQGVPLEVNRYNRALWNMWIGEKDRALSELEAGMRTRPFQMVYLAVETAFEPLHDEPRFQELVRQIGLSAALARAREERTALASTQAPAE